MLDSAWTAGVDCAGLRPSSASAQQQQEEEDGAPMSTSPTRDRSAAGEVRRLAQYRPFEHGGMDLRAVLHDLVLAIAAIEGGKITSVLECRKAFADCWGLEVEVEELTPIIETLVATEQAEKHGKEIRLSPNLVATLEARARTWQDAEERALREWEIEVLRRWPGLDAKELEQLQSDLRDWLYLIIRRHGADAAMMLYPEEERARRFLENIESDGFDSLPERDEPLRSLREQALPAFVRAPTPDQRRFLASLLNIGFYMTVLTIDPTAKSLVKEQLAGIRMYLDTNFLYAVLGGAQPDEVYSARRLIQMSRELGIEFAVTPWTMDEMRTSIASSRREIEAQKALVRPELTDAMLRASGDKGFTRLFWQAYKQTKTQPKDVFDRLEHFDQELERYGIKAMSEGCRAVDQQKERVRDYSSLLNSERWPWQKEWIVLEHDAKSRLLVERLRGDGTIRFSNARYWFLTYDEALPRFAIRVPDNSDAVPDLPFCVSPSAWVQIMRALTPRTDDFDRTVVDLLTSPYVGYRTAVNSAVVQEVVGRMDHYEDASPELAIAVLADTAKVREIEKAVAAENQQAVIATVGAAYSAKAREMEEAIATSAVQAARAEDHRRQAEARATEAELALQRAQGEGNSLQQNFDAEREQWADERERAELKQKLIEEERDRAAHALEEHRNESTARRQRDLQIGAGLLCLIVGIALALILSLVVIHGKWGVGGSVVAGGALSLLGVRLAVGSKWSGEIVMWGSLVVALAAVVATIVSASH
jgi:hypothetical protein